jgi:autotransporter-associated beta strand protein
MHSSSSSWKRVVLLATIFTVFSLVTARQSLAQNGTWTQTNFGNWGDTANWSGATVASGADNTADFGTLDISSTGSPFYYVGIGHDAARTIGHMVFGDTDTATPGAFEIFNALDPNPPAVLTLAGTSPSITVNPLGPIATLPTELDKPAIIDSAIIRVPIAGTAGFTKMGDGILTLSGANTTALAGTINVNEGTLRLGERRQDNVVTGTMPVLNYNVADGATLETALTVGNVVFPTGATTAKYRFIGSAQASVSSMTAAGTTTTLNMEWINTQTVNPGGTWSGFQTVNLTGVTPGQTGVFRLAPNNSFGGAPPTGFNGASFATSTVNIDNVRVNVRTSSQGNLVQMGELNGTTTAVLAGGNVGGGGTAVRYQIGGNNTNSTFNGQIDGTGGLTVNKVGSGTLTFTGTFAETAGVPNSPAVGGLPAGRQGGLFRVTQGAMRFTGVSSIPGGPSTSPTTLTTIEVLSGATFDVSSAPSIFTTQTQQKIQGSGTLLGNWSHAAGLIRPADVGAATPANEDQMSSAVVATAGTINFNGNLEMNGGAIIYDMTPNPASGNDLIAVTGSMALNSGTITPNFLSTVVSSGTYTVANALGGFTGDPANIVVNFPGRGPDTTTFTDGNLLKFTAQAGGDAKELLWKGNMSGAWDIETTENWVVNDANDDIPEKFFEFDTLTFDDTASNKTVTIGTGVLPKPGPNSGGVPIVITNDTPYSFTGAGAIIGATGLTKTGTGNLTMQLANAYTGPTSLSGGGVATIDILNFGGAFGTGALTLDGVTLVGTNFGLSNSSLAIPAGTTSTVNTAGTAGSGGTVTLSALTGDGTLNVTTSLADKWYALNGLGGFTGTLNLTGVDAGTPMHVRLTTAGGGGDLSDIVLNMNDARISNRQGGAAGGIATFTIGELHGDSNSQIRAYEGGGTAQNANWEIGGLNTNSDFAGAIVNNPPTGTIVTISHLTKVGTGTLTLSGTNTYTGFTRAFGGTLRTTTATTLGDLTDVALMFGGTMNLDFMGGSDTVDSLFINGVSQAVGTWGATGSGATNINDDYFSGTGTITVSTQPAPILVGDYNGDNIVDMGDFIVWSKSQGATTLLNRNPTLFGTIGQLDYVSWQIHFGKSGPPGSGGGIDPPGNVPEPATAALLTIMLTIATAYRRQR